MVPQSSPPTYKVWQRGTRDIRSCLSMFSHGSTLSITTRLADLAVISLSCIIQESGLMFETSTALTPPNTINRLRGNLKLSAWQRLAPTKTAVLQGTKTLEDLTAYSDSSVVGSCILIPLGATVIHNARSFQNMHIRLLGENDICTSNFTIHYSMTMKSSKPKQDRLLHVGCIIEAFSIALKACVQLTILFRTGFRR